MSADIESRLKTLKLTLPPAPKPAGSYQPVVVTGSLVFFSGQISRRPDGVLICGKVGRDLSMEEGREAAKMAILNALSAAREAIGLENISRVVRLTGYVQAAEDFLAISDVLNGASDLLLAVFGETGRHARSAVGVASLPMNAAVEVEMTLEIRKP